MRDLNDLLSVISLREDRKPYLLSSVVFVGIELLQFFEEEVINEHN